MAHFLPPEHVRQVNKLEWPNEETEAVNSVCSHFSAILQSSCDVRVVQAMVETGVPGENHCLTSSH